MKKQISTGSGCLIIILFVIFTAWIFSTFSDTPSSSRQWFQGGNLHNATISEWKSATYQNKLATAADWLATTKWKGHLNSPSDFDKMKVKAQMLVKAVDEVVTMKQIDSMKVTEISAAIVTMSNDLVP